MPSLWLGGVTRSEAAIQRGGSGGGGGGAAGGEAEGDPGERLGAGEVNTAAGALRCLGAARSDRAVADEVEVDGFGAGGEGVEGGQEVGDAFGLFEAAEVEDAASCFGEAECAARFGSVAGV